MIYMRIQFLHAAQDIGTDLLGGVVITCIENPSESEPWILLAVQVYLPPLVFLAFIILQH